MLLLQLLLLSSFAFPQLQFTLIILSIVFFCLCSYLWKVSVLAAVAAVCCFHLLRSFIFALSLSRGISDGIERKPTNIEIISVAKVARRYESSGIIIIMAR